MDSKLNHVLQKLPAGTVATQAWLESLGVYRQLSYRYVSQGWLKKVGHGAFIRAGDSVDWFGGVYAMQCQLELPVHVGGLTALLLKGFGHYLPLGKLKEAQLFGEPGSSLPAWFEKHDWDVQVRFHTPQLFAGKWESGFSEIPHGGFSVYAASPEQAIMEVIYLARDNTSLVYAHQLMAGLTTLRPQLLQELLTSCRSVRVKRYFLWSAEQAGHAWFWDLKPEGLDLGSGKRQVFKEGVFNATYQITVPPSEEALPDV